MSDVEELRQRFFPPKPPGLRLLFLMAMPPRTEFFYTGFSKIYDAILPAFQKAYGEQDDFLKAFQRRGYWLDDIVHRRGLKIEASETEEGIKRVAALIARERPAIVVSMYRQADSSFETIALRCVKQSKVSPLYFTLPYPRSTGYRAFFISYLEYIFRSVDDLCRFKALAHEGP